MAEAGEIALPAKVEAASLVAEKTERKEAEPTETPVQTVAALEDGEISEGTKRQMDLEKHLWYRCDCDPAQHHGQSHYWLHFVTRESRWDEPTEPYWIWNAITQTADEAGLQQPSNSLAKAIVRDKAVSTTQAVPEDEEVYERYNPKIHGNYDPTQPYAIAYEQRKAAKRAAEEGIDGTGLTTEEHYAAMATFNRATGAFQTGDQTAERHNDWNKSRRQMGAYFDIDAAANMHDGKSLREERRGQALSKKQLQEFKIKKEDRKRKKRMAFLTS